MPSARVRASAPSEPGHRADRFGARISATTFPMSQHAQALLELDKGHVLGRGVLIPDF